MTNPAAPTPITDEAICNLPVADQLGALLEMCKCARVLERALSAAQLENKRLRAQLRDAKDDERSSATEAMWKERQGEDYGSY